MEPLSMILKACPESVEPKQGRMIDDVLECVMERLSPREVCALMMCSRLFRSLCGADHVWIQLFKLRWPCLRAGEGRQRNLRGSSTSSNRQQVGGECTEIEPCGVHFLHKHPHQGWLEAYGILHREMKSRADTVIAFLKMCSRNDSMEAYDYQKAMTLLSSLELGFYDLVAYLLTPAQGVLLNLISLHFSIVHLHVKRADMREAIARNGVGSRQVCLRWWTMGGWANGFCRRDEMHISTTSMEALTDTSHEHLLKVLERGTVHEVLRVQISADFKSSAWVCRDMHSQR